MSGNRSKSAIFEGVGHFERRLQREGGIAHQPLLVPSSRVIALSCGMKISAVHHLDLSQSTRVTDRRTDGQNYDSQDCPRICSRGKKHGNMRESMVNSFVLVAWSAMFWAPLPQRMSTYSQPSFPSST